MQKTDDGIRQPVKIAFRKAQQFTRGVTGAGTGSHGINLTILVNAGDLGGMPGVTDHGGAGGTVCLEKASGAQAAEHLFFAGGGALGLVKMDLNIALNIALIERAQRPFINIITGDSALLAAWCASCSAHAFHLSTGI